MNGLQLREEFRGKRAKGTAIELSNDANTGATQVSAQQFLGITYPTHDVLHALEAVGPMATKPVVLIGERGLGKSHLLAVLYHVLNDPGVAQSWLSSWQSAGVLSEVPALRADMLVITESLQRQRVKYLWDILFEYHPNGAYARGKWEGLGEAKTHVPSYDLILEMLRTKPVALLLDEFQTWYDGLTNQKDRPEQTWAFNFIQTLSEIATNHPELLLLVVSVRNGDTEGFRQIHRLDPERIDFKGPYAQQDRRRLLLHRLFENRGQISDEQVEATTKVHFDEYIRLLAIPPSEHDKRRRDFNETWPFAPHLLQLLEDQVLIATHAQETRDLIRILADLFKSRGSNETILTAADFDLKDEECGIVALLDSVANAHHRELRGKAERNITAVEEADDLGQTPVPHLREIIGALWLRSLADERHAGADKATLQVDVTKDRPIDDNYFAVELANIREHSFNIHTVGDRLVFKVEENPETKVMSSAKNDRLFADGRYKGQDREQISKQCRYVLESTAQSHRVIVLPPNWDRNPWVTENQEPNPDHPERWDSAKLPIVVVPVAPHDINGQLGRWLKDNLTKRRNTVRFLLPKVGETSIYDDRNLLVLARAVVIATEWGAEYTAIRTTKERELRDALKKRFDQFATVLTWNYAEPEKCTFSVEKHGKEGANIPQSIEDSVRDNLFMPEDFERFVLEASHRNDTLRKLMNDLQEPLPNGVESISWLGEVAMKERVVRLCARGKIALNYRGTELLQKKPGESDEDAWNRMKSRIGSGSDLDQTTIMVPGASPVSTGIPTPKPSSAATATVAPPEIGNLFEPAETGTTSNPTTPIFPPTGIFGGAPTNRRISHQTEQATSALNLLGKIEAWGISQGTDVFTVSVQFDKATGAQLRKLLQNLPDGITYSLSLQKEDKSQ